MGEGNAAVVVALDWTPNVNHIGFYVACQQGLYKEAGLEVKLLPATDEAVQKFHTPANMVSSGQATFAVGPSETAISYATTDEEKPRLAAVAALLNGSASSIAVSNSAGVERPSELAGKKYGSYSGRFEDGIVKELVNADGGDGEKVEFIPIPAHGYKDEGIVKHGSLTTSSMKSGTFDATWVFSHWEGEIARRDNFDMRMFRLEDYGVPYGYTPVLLANVAGLDQEVAKKFLSATAKGFAYAASNPKEAAKILVDTAQHSACSDLSLVEAAAEAVASKILPEDSSKGWGHMEEKKWSDFVNFLFEKKLVKDREGELIPQDKVDVKKLFTNEFLSN